MPAPNSLRQLQLPVQVYNDADPWTGPGVLREMPTGRNLTYDLGGGGVSHCVYPAFGAQPWIKWWASKPLDG